MAMAGTTGSTAAAPEQTPAEWRPWVLASADQFRSAAPPSDGSRRTRRELDELVRLQSLRTRSIRKQIRFWDRQPLTVPWTRLELRMIKEYRPRPPFSARALSLLHVAMFDALVAAWDSRLAYQRTPPRRLDDRIRPLVPAPGSPYPSPHAVIAGAAEEVLTYLFPSEDASTFDRVADEAVRSRLFAGVNYRSDLTRGRALGRDIGAAVVAYARADRSDSTGYARPRPEGEGYWDPTPPGYETPAGGPVGKWLPWLMSDGGQARRESGVPEPFAYGSEEFIAEVHEVIDGQAELTSDQKQIAVFWDDGPGTFTPSGHWNDIALDLVKATDMGTQQTARLFAYLNAAQADSAIAFFEAKYEWWTVRPVTAVRRLCDDATRLCTEQELADDPSRRTYPDWLPYIVTPPFPSYPGGHSTFSGSAARVLGEFFPSSAGELSRFADEAAQSRFFGGIHFNSDNEAGLTVGRWIGDRALERAATDGSSN